MTENLLYNPGLEDIESPGLADFFGLWQRLCHEHKEPAKNLSWMTQFAAHLPLMSIVGYDRETDRFQIRLVGNALVEGFGVDHTNVYIDEIPDSAEQIVRTKWLVENKQPYLLKQFKMRWSVNDFLAFDILACPLFNSEGEVDAGLMMVERSASD